MNKIKEKKDRTLLRNKRFLRTPIDLNLLIVIILLNIFGMVMIYSASYFYAQNTYGYAPDYFFVRQAFWVGAGFVAMILISFIRPKYYKKLTPLFLVGAYLLVLAVRVPGIGHASHGAYRWVKFGPLQLQIAEPVKICVIGALAGILSTFKADDNKVTPYILGGAAVLALMLWKISSNMSTAMIMVGITYVTLMIRRKNAQGLLYFMIGVIVMAAIFLFILNNLIPYSENENFRITRIRAWLNPTDELYASDKAYQSTQALYAIASGGFFGKGLGRSLLKFKLPEPHNDYILAIVFEELGVFGVLILTYLFMYLFYKMIGIYRKTKNPYCQLLVLGVFLHLAIQMVFNYAVAIGLFPTMGVTLPFISYGGSAAAFALAELGVVIAVQRQNTEDELYAAAEKEVRYEDPHYNTVMLRKEEDREARNKKIAQKKAAARRRAASANRRR